MIVQKEKQILLLKAEQLQIAVEKQRRVIAERKQRANYFSILNTKAQEDMDRIREQIIALKKS